MMKLFLICSITAVTVSAFAADTEPPKLEPVPRPAALVAKPEATNLPQQKEITKSNDEYVAAFNQGDFETLATIYTEDADRTDGDGNIVVAGRAAIKKQWQDYFHENQGAAIELSTVSVRLFAPEVLLENGQAVTTLPDGDTTTTSYFAFHVKREGKWLIAHLTETPVQTAVSPSTHLQGLDWMVGSWKDDTSEAEVGTTCQWAKNKTFLTRSFSARTKDRGELAGTEVMGWDPIKGTIHTWVFDSEGGYGEGTWTRDGERWLVQSVTTLPDGRKASACDTITHVSDDKYTWESSNRVLDGEVRPNIDKIVINRVKSNE